MENTPAARGARVIERCRSLGFAAAGICAAEPSGYHRELQAWLAAGKHGSMEYLARHAAIRADPAAFLPGCASLILVADLYHSRADAPDPPTAQGHGRVARYARGRDYHDVIKRRLFALADDLRCHEPDAQFRAFVDTAPVLEREHAARAGLGWIGKHTLLIHPRLGSFTLLGGVATTLRLEPPAEQRAVADHCGTCTRCIDACPTQAITPYSVDASRCVSYLTIERRGPIEPELFAGIGEWIYGCDVCQEVCPHTSPRPAGVECGERNPAYAESRRSLGVLDVLGWDEEARREAFRSSAMKRASLAMMKRNALIVAGNLLRRAAVGEATGAALRARLAELAASADEPEMVIQTARAVLAFLDGSGGSAAAEAVHSR